MSGGRHDGESMAWGVRSEPDHRSMLDRFGEQVDRTPDAPAVRAGDLALDYRALDARVERLAARLLACGVQRGDLVGVLLPRSVDLVIALLAILRTGAAYVPLDPAHPQERLQRTLDVACCRLVLTTGPAAVRQVQDACGCPLDVAASATDVASPLLPVADVADVGALDTAYVIFTSGTTGRPKGVVVPHGAVANFLTAMQDVVPLGPGTRMLSVTTVSFDISVLELFGPLAQGGEAVLADAAVASDLDALATLVSEVAPTAMQATPSHWFALVEEHPEVLTGLRVLVGGEALPADLAAMLAAGAQSVTNLYGPTEACVWATRSVVQIGAQGQPDIGTPLRNVHGYVLDDELAPVPRGTDGELYLAGAGLADGYLGQARLTADHFVADPWGPPGSRMYRTGDLAQLDAGGMLHCLGRLDHQLKVRGHRVQAEEVEGALRSHPCVVQAVVDIVGGHLVAHIVPASGTECDHVGVDHAELPTALRELTSRSLPAYMVPDQVRLLAELPVTANGKLDRVALRRNASPQPTDPDDAVGGGETCAAGSDADDVPELVRGVVAAVLGRSVRLTDSTASLGADSLEVARITSRLRRLLAVEVSLREVFAARDLADLAVQVDQLRPARCAVVAAERPERPPLSFGQRSLWFLDQFEAGGGQYHLPMAWTLHDEPDPDALRGAVERVCARHEALRTVLRSEDGDPHQHVCRRPSSTPTTYEVPAGKLMDAVRAAASRPFFLAQDTPMRVELFLAPAERPVLLVTVHHVAADGWSMDLLADELWSAYDDCAAGSPCAATGLPVQYVDYALWQQRLLLEDGAPSARSRDLRRFWAEQMADLPDELGLTTDRPRPPVPSHRAVRLVRQVPAPLRTALTDLARECGATPFMALHAVFVLLLHAHGAGQDVLVGTASAGRGDEALEPLIGHFVSTVVLRTRLDDRQTFRELLHQVCRDDLAAFAHEDLPFEQLVELLSPPRSAGRHPLFQAMLVMDTLPGRGITAHPLVAGVQPVPLDAAKFDVHVAVSDLDGTSGTGWQLDAEVAADLFDPTSAELLADRLVAILTACVRRPDAVVGELVSADVDELARLVALNDTHHDVPSTTLAALVQAGWASDPTAPALLDDDTALSHADLRQRVLALATRLRGQGVRTGDVVAVCLARSVDLVVAVHAVVQAGAAYLPLDPDYPHERLHLMVADSGARLVLAGAETARLVDDLLAADEAVASVLRVDRTTPEDGAVAADGPPADLTPGHPAYLIYTSGSTGRPKGVLVSHQAIVNRLLWMQGAYRLDPTDRVLHKTPASFDVSVWELFWPVLTGATMVLARSGGHRDPRYLADLVQRNAVSTAHFVPSMLDAFLAEPRAAGCTSLRRVVCSGEELTRRSVDRFTAMLPDAELHNLYGPTEAAVDVTAWHCRPGERGPVPIGAPIWNTQAWVLDDRLRPVAAGCTGELYLAGTGLALGYVARSALTADRFIADPRGGGGRLYRTGDQARWNAAGVLEFLGRRDDQVKLRGLRIELGEVEAVLAGHPDVACAAALVRPGAGGEPVLTGFVVLHTVAVGRSVTATQLRAYAGQRVPEHLVPTLVAFLNALPLGPSGKLDRKVLAAMPLTDLSDGAGRDASTATSPVVAEVLDLMGEVLQRAGLGPDDDFFALGGHSLMMVRLIGRIRARLGVDLSVGDVFAAPTARGLAALLPQSGAARTAVAAARPDRLPLSPGQERLWFLDQLQQDRSPYTVSVAFAFDGALDASTLQAALTDVAARHEVLRTVIRVDGDAASQQVLDAHQPALRVHRVSPDALPLAVEQATAQPFDLTSEPPLRAHLLQSQDGGHGAVLVLCTHHIAVDGASVHLLLADLARAYAARAAGRAPSWSPLPVQYADFAVQRSGVTSPDAERYWVRQLADAPSEVTIAGDRPRPAVASHRGRLVALEVGAEVYGRLRALAQQCRATPFMAVHAALVALLVRNGAGTDVLVGAAVDGRGEQELSDVVGFFTNSMVLRVDAGGRPSLRELLERVRTQAVDAMSHPDVPFERLVELINPPRSLGQHPLFQVMLAFQEEAERSLRLGDQDGRELPLDPGVAAFDLSVSVAERRTSSGIELTGTLELASDLYERATGERLARQLVDLLTCWTAFPDAPITVPPLVPAAERAALVRVVDPVDGEAATFTDLFTAQAQATPDADAVLGDDVRLSYAELDRRAEQVARTLRRRGVGPDVVVGLCLPRSAELLVGYLAVGKAGGACLPIDPAYPAARREFIVADAAPALVLTPELVADLEQEQPDLVQAASGKPRGARTATANLAYVIYTSGSTGVPKGVEVTHGGVLPLALTLQDRLGVGPGSRVLQFSSIGFDAMFWELCMTLLSGATLVLADDEQRLPAGGLEQFVARHGVTHATLAPAVLAAMPPYSTMLSGGTLVLAGEALSAELAARWAGDRRVVNAYGPTETTVCATLTAPLPAQGDGAPPIGHATGAAAVLVLDDDLHLVPVAVIGELYVAGPLLARGYRARPDLTALRFVANPYGRPGERMYRTGDLVRRMSDGQLQYVGRADQQVKINGFRVELGEIEARLVRDPAVAQAAVVVRTTPQGQHLVAYVVSAVHEPGLGVRVRTDLAAFLPHFMVPSAVLTLEELPLTPHGKVDTAALADRDGVASVSAGAAVGATADERRLCAVFAEVLGLGSVAPDQDFFDAGGHSLLASRLVVAVHREFGVQPSLQQVFTARTPAALAVALGSSAGSSLASPAVADARTDTSQETGAADGTHPLTPAQQGLWFLDDLEGRTSATYNVPVRFRLTGDLDFAAMNAAVADVVARHEVLRTRFPLVDDVPVQQVVPVDQATVVVLRQPVSAAGVDDAVRAACHRPIDVRHELPVRAWLYELEAADTVLLLVFHHIAFDGASLDVLCRDLSQAYQARSAGRAPAWEPLALQFGGFARDLARRLGAADDPSSLLHRQLDYWRTQLADVPDVATLASDRARPARPSGRGASTRFEIPAEVHAAVLALAREHAGTAFSVLHASLAAVLSRLGAGSDVPLGVVLPPQHDDRLASMIGFFVNTVVLRTPVDAAAPFAQLLDGARTVGLAAMDHRDVPFDRVVDAVRCERDLAQHPLFQVVVTMDASAGATPDLPGLRVAAEDALLSAAKFDLSLELRPHLDEAGTPAGITVLVEYALDLYDPSTVQAFGRHWLHLLSDAVRHPERPVGDLAMMDDAERDDALAQGAGPDLPVQLPPKVRTGVPSLAAGFADQVDEHPDRPAVVGDDGTLSYAQLDARSAHLAERLLRAGLRPEEPVLLAVTNGLDYPVAVLGVVRAGGAYVPLHPGDPAQRWRTVAADCQARLLLTDDVLADQGAALGLPTLRVRDRLDPAVAGEPTRLPALEQPDSRLAYVMYTSGSTGRPKGVSITHRAVLDMAFGDCWEPFQPWRMLVQSSFAFDASTLELWGPLLRGGTLVMAGSRQVDLDVLRDMVSRYQVTGTFLTTGLFHAVAAEDPRALAGLQVVVTGGDVVSPEAVRCAQAACPDLTVLNIYGPTEVTVLATAHPVPPGGQVGEPLPIGRTRSAQRVRLLGPRLESVPDGVVGEVYVGGSGVARGYLDAPVRTAQRFVADPYGAPGERLYRTGDLARRGPDGVLGFCGRADGQVKLRGFRIELGEVEASVRQVPGVAQVCVVLRQDRPGDKRLVAYLVPAATAPAAVRDWRERVTAHLTPLLPAYLVPSQVVLLDRLPLNRNGKVDRAALPAPSAMTCGGGPASTQPVAAPADVGSATAMVRELFTQLLGSSDVGADDDFFQLGGDSILAIQLVSRAQRRGLALRTRDVFDHRTPARLAGHGVSAAPAAGSPPGPGTVAGPAPATPAMHWWADHGGVLERFSQSVVLLTPAALDPERLVRALQTLLDHHDALRLRCTFPSDAGDPTRPGRPQVPSMQVLAPGAVPAWACLRQVPVTAQEDLTAAMAREVESAVRSLRPQDGVVLAAVWLDAGRGRAGRLCLVAHHYAVDAVSWSILVPDLAQAYHQDGGPLDPVPTSWRTWAEHLTAAAGSAAREGELALWQRELAVPNLPLTDRSLDRDRDLRGTVVEVSGELSLAVSIAVTQALPSGFGCTAGEVLLAGLAAAVHRWRGDDPTYLVDVESHGRHEDGGSSTDAGLDVSRTVGWFTSIAPVRIGPLRAGAGATVSGALERGRLVKAVKEAQRCAPQHGLGYGLLRYLNPRTGPLLAALPCAQVAFNYLGRFPVGGGQPWAPAADAAVLGASGDPDAPATHALDVSAWVQDEPGGPRVCLLIGWPRGVLDDGRGEQLLGHWQDALADFGREDDPASHDAGMGGLTPSDVSLLDLDQVDIDLLESEWKDLL